jgi:hypothetical protein
MRANVTERRSVTRYGLKKKVRLSRYLVAGTSGSGAIHTAAVTFSGIELAHRIRKRQFTLTYERAGRTLSLKDLWDQALSGKSFSDTLDKSPPPLMHQISRRSRPRLRERRARNGVVRFRRKVSFGHSLYLQVSPTGRRYWHYRYRFEGRQKQLSLGRFPYVPVESAWARRHAARHLLEAGVDPRSQIEALRRINADGV